MSPRLALLLALAPAAEARPNILVLETDDQTLDEMAYLPKTRALIGDQGASVEGSTRSGRADRDARPPPCRRLRR